MADTRRPEAITELLGRMAQGERAVAEALATAVVGHLERIADRELALRNAGGLHGLTLEPRMFAHDALMEILGSPLAFENRRHFYAYATQVMAHAMIDYQRRRAAIKRGGDLVRVSLACAGEADAFDAVEVAQLLDALEAVDPRKADLVRLRVFLGATMEEAAEALAISLSSAERDWRFVRRWLGTQLAAGQTDPGTGSDPTAST